MSLFRIKVSGDAYVKAANASYEEAYEVEFEVKYPLYKETSGDDSGAMYSITPTYGSVLRHVLDSKYNLLDKELKKLDKNIKMAKTAVIEKLEFLGPKSQIDYYIEQRKQAIRDSFDSFKFKQDGKLNVTQVQEMRSQLAFVDAERAHIEKLLPVAAAKTTTVKGN